jgi:predicted DNA-binding ribbon-helix-helix protein
MRSSSFVKRSIVIGGRKTSVSLEEPFWNTMREISAQRGMTLGGLVSAIDNDRQQNSNLSSAIRLFVLDHYKKRALGPTGEPRPFDHGQLAGTNYSL